MRENDGADYVVSLGGRINSSLLDLIPAYCNVRVRFVDNSTMHSDTCSFHRALVDFGRLELFHYASAVWFAKHPDTHQCVIGIAADQLNPESHIQMLLLWLSGFSQF